MSPHADGQSYSSELEMVCAEMATLVGLVSPDEIEENATFREAGIYGRAAAELVARLSARCGLLLPESLVFDCPTPAAAARLLYSLRTNSEPLDQVTAEESSDDPVAIIGMSCRLPGGITSPEEFWRLVSDGVDAISGPPVDRGWDLAGSPYPGMGGFLPDCAEFDPGFFGISPAEALLMDPQQRLLLETAWEATESARVDPQSLRGSRTAVYAGVSTQDYGPGVVRAPENSAGQLFLGTVNSVASGRVAYTLGLEGPTVTVDTACSSSLVALHWAARSLRLGECDFALAGGVAVMCTPALPIAFSEMRATAADGRCRAFAASANGTGWSEGAGFLLLERLSDARRRGHRVLAVVRGSAINQDGASNGLTAPNGPAQQRVIRQALANARLSGSDVDLVEAHGTGTRLGDPIEAQALLATYGQGRTEPFLLGSVKSNIGHTQAAAGVAGVIKMVLAMQHGVAPKTLHVDEPTPKVDWGTGSCHLLTDAVQWPDTGRPRRSAVSSFGAGGTNVHVILEQAPEDQFTAPRSVPQSAVSWLVSARSASALRAQAARLEKFLGDRPELGSHDIARSLASTRSTFEHRAVVVGEHRDDLLAGVAAVAAGVPYPSVVTGTALPARRGVVLVFPGQGSQWAGMAEGLLDHSEVFAQELSACDAALSRYVRFSVQDLLRNRSVLDRVDVLQPVLFAVMVSLAALWRATGVRIAGVVGHSQGEVAAAYVAGALSLDDAARIVAVRSRLVGESLSGKGGMASVSLPAAAIPSGISIAAINSPDSTVVSGPTQVLDELLEQWASDGVRAKRIAVDYASHSSQVEKLAVRLREELKGVRACSSSIPFYSTVTGKLLDTKQLDTEYWYRNLREPVLFQQAVQGLVEHGFGAFVEVSPHPVLVVPLEGILEDAGVSAMVTGTLRRDEEDVAAFQRALAVAHVHGHSIRWDSVLPPANTVDLPTYAFQRNRFWLHSQTGDPTLDEGVQSPVSGEWVFRGRISPGARPWLLEHSVRGTALAAGSFLVELALRAGRQAGFPHVEELALHTPMVLRDGEARDVRVVVTDERRVTVFSTATSGEHPMVEHATGTLAPAAAPSQAAWATVWPPPGAESVYIDDIYERFADHGYEYGKAFRGLRAAWRRGDEIFAEVELTVPGEDEFGIHPALLDAALHPWTRTLTGDGPVQLPFAWGGVSLYVGGAKLLRVRLTPQGAAATAVEAADLTGSLVLSVDSLVARAIDGTYERSAAEDLYSVEWIRGIQPDDEPRRWEVTGEDPFGVAAAVARTTTVGSAGPIDMVVVSLVPPPHLTAQAAYDAAERVLELVRQYSKQSSGPRLLVVTRGAVAASDEDKVDNPAHAVAWGLLRTAQTERPGQFVLADLDHYESSVCALPTVIRADEPQIAIRRGIALVPRLRHLAMTDPAVPVWTKGGTVLIVGGTGSLGAEVGRHLVVEHGISQLVLVGRNAENALGLREELLDAGAESVKLVACDASDRASLAAALADIPSDHPLTGVVHAAGVLDDGTLDSLTLEQVHKVMRSKVDIAVNLHELTAGYRLSAFVLFSSIAGLFGTAGQANYAAANAFLDSLAAHRRARGLPGTSLAWGFWEQRGALTRHLEEGDVARLARSGVSALSTEFGLRLFDLAQGAGRPLVVPARLNLASLSRLSSGPLTRTAPPASTNTAPAGARSKLVELSEPPIETELIDLVRMHVATVLGYEQSLIEQDREFHELGFDSLKAVELRNSLSEATGLRLPAPIVFSYPSPRRLAARLTELLQPRQEGTGGDRELAALVASIPMDRLRRAGLLDTLVSLAGGEVSPGGGEVTPPLEPKSLDEMSADELVRAALDS